MKICFISNYLSPHQMPFCNAINVATKGNFTFIATTEVTGWRKKMGFKVLSAPYLLDSSISEENWRKALDIVYDADVVVTDAEDLQLTKKRHKDGKLTFRCSERLFKSRLRYIKAPIHWLRAWRTRNMNLLCCSAYSAKDFNMIGFYKKRCYKWGYFPEVKVYEDLEQLMSKKRKSIEMAQGVSILWVSRLIGLKHPELAVELADYLRTQGVKFHLNMIGIGNQEEKTRNLIKDRHLNSEVSLLGALPMDEVRSYMEQSEIFVFTSDRNEGWGAVMNESMNSACAVVANKAIGSVPYLIKDKVNGLVYSSKKELFKNVEWLINHPKERQEMGKAAYKTIIGTWNADIAAKNFINLVSELMAGKNNTISEGPCSKT